MYQTIRTLVNTGVVPGSCINNWHDDHVEALHNLTASYKPLFAVNQCRCWVLQWNHYSPVANTLTPTGPASSLPSCYTAAQQVTHCKILTYSGISYRRISRSTSYMVAVHILHTSYQVWYNAVSIIIYSSSGSTYVCMTDHHTSLSEF